MSLVLIPSRQINYDILPKESGRRTLVDETMTILDGHHAYYSHLLYGTPLEVEVLRLSRPFQVDIDRLRLTHSPTAYRDIDLEEMMALTVLVYKHNGVYVIERGNTIVPQAIKLGFDRVNAQVIL